MTQDRTRAIVEAAERLAKAMNLRPDGNEWTEYDTTNKRDGALTNEAEEALIEFAHALALPADPPTPESKLRAVYEAAEKLAMAADLYVHEGADGSPYLSHDAIDIDDLRDDVKAPLLDLVRAISLPSPQWTRTPPSEPGWYFYKPSAPECVGDAEPRGMFDIALVRRINGHMWYESLDGSNVRADAWFPVRIEEPPS